VAARETYFLRLSFIVMSCFVSLGLLAHVSLVEPQATSEDSKVPRRFPPRKLDELRGKAEEYGAEPPTLSEAGEPSVPPKVAGCECRPPGELWCKKELTGFKPGAFTHPQLEDFARSVATLTKLNDPSAQRTIFRVIKIVGQTDGLENPGICCWRDLVKFENECSSIMPEASPNLSLNERLLGLARACVTRKALERKFRDSLLLLPKDWPTYAEDIETGGLVGGQHRKATVEIWIKDGC